MAALERILADLHALAEMVNCGEAGLAAIQRLVELVQRAVESDGASFVEFGPAGGRVIAGSGAASWALGRQVDQADSLVDDDHLERVVEIRAEEIPTPLGKQLAGRGVRRLIAVEVEVAGQAVGLLRAYFSEDSPAGELRRSTLALFGAVAGHLYADNRGLPVYADAPAVATLADAIVVVGPDGAVRSWNPAATVVMGRTAGAALGRPLPVPLPFDLPEAIRTALADLPVETRRQVQVELPDMLPKALGERASLATVFAELITNAIKYSPPGSPVELSSVVDIGTVGFRVADRGIGVRPEHVERVFERFWQAESGSDRRYPGVGLGLYLVRRIVERQNGWVSLRPP